MRRITVIAIIFLFTSILGVQHLEASDLTIEIKAGDSAGIVAEFKPEAGLDMGQASPDAKVERTLEIKNSLKKDLLLQPPRSPCPCLEVECDRESVKPGEAATLRIALRGESYRGAFNKYISLALTAGKSEKSVLVPVRFTILGGEGEEAAAPKPAQEPEGPITFSEYKDGGLGVSNAIVWIFSAKGCASCAFLRKELLPKLFERSGIAKGVAMNVDLDIKANMEFLLELESRLGVSGQKTPVLYWDGKLIYGNDDVKTLIESLKKD